MEQQKQPLIVGAGPVGLGAALFLRKQGRDVRIVEAREEPSQQSRALAINPRTLDLLEPVGVTRRLLERGLPIYGGRLYRSGRIIGGFEFTDIHPKHPFMLGLSQAVTERLLAEEFEGAGGVVERGVRLEDCRDVGYGVEATLDHAQGHSREVVRCPWLLAADGAHSVVREQMGVKFPGSSFPHEWHLADLPLHTTLAPDHVHIFFGDEGEFLLVLRAVADARREQTENALWRIIGNRPDPVSRLTLAEPAGAPVWASSFRISHHLDATLSIGAVYFAGDAAHLHSPAGARGMNLGLEDAWVFAQLVQANRLEEYDRLRRPVDRQVVRQVKMLSRVVDAESGLLRFVRQHMFPFAFRMPFLRSRIIGALTGLDHDLPHLERRQAA